MIGNVACVFECQEPAIVRSSTGVKEVLYHSLDIPYASLGKVLILIVRFTGPAVDSECSKNLFYLPTDLSLGIVTDECVHSSVASDVLLECFVE